MWNRQSRADSFFPISISGIILPLILCILPLYAYACDMTVLVGSSGRPITGFDRYCPNTNFTAYDNPTHFLAFIMSRSTTSLNNDGYGLVYYNQDSYLLPATQKWYKYVNSDYDHNRVFYTGNYFVNNRPDDVLDTALQALSQTHNATIVMCHARNASANPFAPGNHPFTFTLGDRSYAFMHNGVVSTDCRTFMINNIMQRYPYWFDRHSPNYSSFPQAYSPGNWIDSELLFHYIMSYIMDTDGNAYLGLHRALKGISSHVESPVNVFNFILSDGSRVYAYRSSSLKGANAGYRLNYRQVRSDLYAIRTGNPAHNDQMIPPYQLTVLSTQQPPAFYPDFINTPPADASHYDVIHPSAHDYDVLNINPYPQGLTISFDLQRNQNVSISVYNQKGQFVRRLCDRSFDSGKHAMVWDGTNSNGSHVADGVYLLRFLHNGKTQMHKVTLISK